MSKFPKMLYTRIVEPDTADEFLITGSELNDVSDDAVGESATLSLKVARYALVGTGEIHHTAPRYVEDTVS